MTLVLHVTGNNTIRIEAGSATLEGHGAVTWPETFMRLGDGEGYNADRYFQTETSAPDSPYTDSGYPNLRIYNDMTASGFPSSWFDFQMSTSGFPQSWFNLENQTTTLSGNIRGSLIEGAPTAESSGDPFISPLFQ